MSFNLAPIALSSNVQTSLTFPGSLGSIAWVKIANASPYTVALTNLGPGQDWIQPMEVNIWPMAGITGSVGVLPQPELTGVTAPVSSLFVTCYLDGEQPPSGSYPFSLGLLNFIGGGTLGTATQVINDINPATNTVVEARPTGLSLSRLLFSNDGTFVIQYGLTDPAVKIYLEMTPGAGLQMPQGFLSGGPVNINNTASVGAAALDVQAGFTNLDNGAVTTDGSGNVTAHRINMTQITNTGVFSSDNGLVTTNGAGTMTIPVLTVNAPPVLATGHQETGYAVGSFYATAGGQTIFSAINFKTVMTNVPSSLTLNVITSLNFSGTLIGNINKYGATLGVTSTAAGQCYWVGTYTTVGN